MVKLLVTLVGVILTSMLALAQSGPVSNGVVKIGVLGDMAGCIRTRLGKGAVEAVKSAVEDFGGAVLGKPIERLSRPIIKMCQISQAVLLVAGTIMKTST